MTDATTELIHSSLDHFAIELPSWGFADTGTRFGKFFQPAAAIDLNDKLNDAAQVHAVTGACPTVALHVLWDFTPGQSASEVKAMAEKAGVAVGSINPNLFQDQAYKLGSLCSPEADARRLAQDHVLDSIQLAKDSGSKVITLWLADGTNYPGQDSIRARKARLEEGLSKFHSALDADQTFLIEYKPFEPAFYHTDIADWGMSFLHAKKMGDQAKVLVDTGHHYQSQNIEQIVAWLLDEKMLGGFHFNDRRYADDDLTLGSIDPYQIFRIFYEIHSYAADMGGEYPHIEYMVDQSHNLKPKIEAMIQTVDTAQKLYAKAAIVDHAKVKSLQENGRIVDAENLLKSAFEADINGPLAEWRQGDANPLTAFRESGYYEAALEDRTRRRADLGLTQASSYA
jgi:L-rhamnose isomerase/sugar isomerase